MTDKYEPLDDSDRDDAVELLSREPEHNLLAIHNINSFGLEHGDTACHGEYFGRRSEKGLEAIGALYELGSMILYCRDPDYLAGMGDYLNQLGRTPYYIFGKREQVERFLDDVGAGFETEVRRHVAELMVLRGEVSPGLDLYRARRARGQDLETLVKLQTALEIETFGRPSMPAAVVREILDFHVDNGTAFVVEDEGRIVTKGEGRLAGGLGANIGGVYTVPSHRGKGFATACMAGMCSRLLKEVPVVTLDVEKENERGIALYRRIGFESFDDRLIATMTPG